MKRTIYIVILLLFVGILHAQTLTSYTCDFENPSENAQWVLNYSTRDISACANRWNIGPAGGFGLGTAVVSSAGLYVSASADTLKSAYSNSQSVFITAARELQLAQGSYNVVFDWEAMGSNAVDGIYVFWVESGNTYYNYIAANWNDRSSLSLPPYATNTTRYGNASTWTSSTFSFTTAGNGGKLVVLWLNTLSPVQLPAGKVDNICIYPGAVCQPPTNVRYNSNTNTLSWNGNAASYDVNLYNYYTQSLSTYTGVTGNSLPLDLSEEGYYYIYVRSANGTGHSTWSYTEKFVWVKGARCIDLFDIGPANGNFAGKCYTGNFDDFIRFNQQGTPGMVDNGPSSPESMHTIHIDRNEIDPIAKQYGGYLHTVPTGEIASVRLGAYTGSGQSSRIEYKYTVTQGMSDLLDLKYAVVMNSGGHGSSLADSDMNPTFTLNVLDGNGRQLDACVQRYFVAGYGDQSNWHQDPEGSWYWSDWQTVTVSLREYVGQTITIRLTSTRCSYDTHPAYAYFTMNCRSGDLQGIACGDFNTDHFEAPEGFNYRWYRADDSSKQVLETNQVFNIAPDDPSIYLVDVIDRNSAGCYYTLEANPNPRFPQARAKMLSARTAQCQNIVDFEQESKVVRINRVTYDSIDTEEPIGAVIWNFGDGTPDTVSLKKQVTHAYPAEGGTFTVTVRATMPNDICADEQTFQVVLPDITTPDTHEEVHYCGEGTDYKDTVTHHNTYGCEYHQIKHHIYHPLYDTIYTERICEGTRYYFPGDGKYYTATVDTTVQLRSIYNCDSLISLSLVVDPRLEVEYPHNLKVCSEDNAFTMPYRTISGSMDSIKIYFSEKDQEQGFAPVYGFANGEEVVIPLPANARPDIYNVQVEFGGERCQMDLQQLQLMVTYPASIVMQSGGFIATQNANYNGGYEFIAFAWMRNGEKMNETSSYIPTSPSDIGATYVLSLVREGENYAVESCPIYYSPGTQGIDLLADGAFRVWPTSIEGGGTLYRSAGAACTVYSVLGTPVATYPKSDVVSSFAAPSQSGMYIVVFDNHQSLPIIVR